MAVRSKVGRAVAARPGWYALALALAGLALTGCSTANSPATPSAPPASSPVASVTAHPTESTAAAAASGGCPATVDQLNAAVQASQMDHLPIKDGTIICYQGWAMATPDFEGNGVYLFHYDDASGSWKAVDEGSSIDCKPLGMPKETLPHFDVCDDQDS